MVIVVYLDVGGQIFKTTRTTLTHYEGYFNDLMDTFPVETDNTPVFIDRSPKNFESILNFMRDGKLAVPPTTIQEILEIRNEASYFWFNPLIEECNKLLEKRNYCQIQLIKNSEEYLNIVATVKKLLVLIYVTIDEKGEIERRENINANQFFEKFSKDFDIYFYILKPTKKSQSWSYKLKNVNGKMTAESNYKAVVDIKKELEASQILG